MLSDLGRETQVPSATSKLRIFIMIFEQAINIKLYELMILSAIPFLMDRMVRAVFSKKQRKSDAELKVAAPIEKFGPLPQNAISSNSSLALSPSSPPQAAPQIFDQIALVNAQKKPVVSMSLMSVAELKAAGKKLRAIDANSISSRHLTPIIGALPALGFTTALGNGNLMRVIVDGPLHPGKIEGTLSPVVRNSNGSIKSWAALKDPAALKQAANIAMAWQIASVIVAQKHLADIDRKLQTIEKGVDEIRNFLDTQRTSVITGTLSYLKQAHSAVTHGDFNPLFREKMESFEVDLLRVQNHLISELQSKVSDASKIEKKSFLKLSNKDLITDIESTQSALRNTLATWLLCVQTRAACWQVLSAFPGEMHLKKLRQSDIVDSISQVLIDDGLLKEIKNAIREAVMKIDGKFNKTELARQRQSFEKEIADCLDDFSVKAIDMQEKVHQLGDSLLSYDAQPLQLVVRMKKDRELEFAEIC